MATALVLTTATNRFLTAPIAALLGIADLVATDLEIATTGEFTGRTTGIVNMREGKVARLAHWLAGEGLAASSLAAATFYSDSINDLPLLVRGRHAGRRRSRLALASRGAASRLAGDLASRLNGRSRRRRQALSARQTSDAPLASSRIQIARAACRGGSRRCRWLPMK